MATFGLGREQKPPKLESIEEAGHLYIDRNGGLSVDPDELRDSEEFGTLLKDAARWEPYSDQEDGAAGS